MFKYPQAQELFQLITLEVDSMPSIDTDTKLIMTILFVGAVSGVNVYFYATVADMLLFGTYIHAILFGVLTVGGIMIMKALFDLLLNDYIEDFLLQRQINNYWDRKAREEDNRKRVRESLRNFQQQFGIANTPYGDNMMPNLPIENKEPTTVSPTFLTGFQE